MKLLIVIFSVLFALYSQSNASTPTTPTAPNAECRIYSDTYKEYIYAKYKFLGLGSFREVHLWRENKHGLTTSLYRHQPKVYFNDDDESGVWYFEPVPGRPNTFYIRNKKYSNEYLRASDMYQELVYKKNRALFTAKIDEDKKDDDEWFMWTLSRDVESDKPNRFHITNVKLGVPVYSRLFYSVKHDRLNNPVRLVSLYNMPLPQPASENFEWLLKCRDRLMPNLETI